MNIFLRPLSTVLELENGTIDSLAKLLTPPMESNLSLTRNIQKGRVRLNRLAIL